MKHGILMMAHNNTEVVKTCLRMLDDERFTLFLLVDAKSPLKPEDFLPELRETAASLSMIAGAEIDRAALETAFLEELEALRRELPQETAERRQEYGAACLNLGHRVRVLRPGGEREALAVSLTPDYGLAVRYDDGTEEVLRSGEVSVRGLYGYTDKE